MGGTQAEPASTARSGSKEESRLVDSETDPSRCGCFAVFLGGIVIKADGRDEQDGNDGSSACSTTKGYQHEQHGDSVARKVFINQSPSVVTARKAGRTGYGSGYYLMPRGYFRRR